jgi:putative protein kinase ArgK-like GTPase of G3E family
MIGRERGAMHKVIDGGKLEFAKPGEAGVEARYDCYRETRYDYYRRCQALRANGLQCKAPAMKDHDICRKHAEQREKSLRAESQRRDFVARISERPEGEVSDAVRVNRTIRDLMQAMLDGLIDEDTAGAMLDEIALRQGLLGRF